MAARRELIISKEDHERLETLFSSDRVGDLVRWQVPSGLIHFQIEKLLFQPERDIVVT